MTTVTETNTYGFDTPVEFLPRIASLQKNATTMGIRYPLTLVQGYGAFNKATDRTLLAGMVYQFMNTQTGERPMLPNYGVDLEQFLFEPLDESLHGEIVTEIHTAVATNHPEWQILSLSVLQSDDTTSLRGIPGILIILNIKIRDDEAASVEVQVTI